MKVQELRQMLSSAERSRIEKAFVESYKQLKKYQKEEADILIRDILSGQSERKLLCAESCDSQKPAPKVAVLGEGIY